MKRYVYFGLGFLLAGAVGLVSINPALAAQVTCSLTTIACDGGNNTSTGPGVRGDSAKGSGVFGKTAGAAPGVYGRSYGSASDVHTVGVYGYSSNVGVGGQGATVGVQGVSLNGTGILGQSPNGVGIKGTTSLYNTGNRFAAGVVGADIGTRKPNSPGPNSVGVYGTSTDGIGLQGSSSNNFGVCGVSLGLGESGTCNGGLPAGVMGWAYEGVVGISFSGYGLFAIGGGNAVGLAASNDSDSVPAVLVQGGSDGGTAAAGRSMLRIDYRGTHSACAYRNGGYQTVLSVDQLGNLGICGTLTQGAGPIIVTQTTTGKAVLSYGSRVTEPTIEDVGQSQLINGQAQVRIDPSFASTMDHRAPYMVFLTPNGDSRGLYVTAKLQNGFVVRENESGHSTLLFDYRIVAKPFDSARTRLPNANTLPTSTYKLPAMPRFLPHINKANASRRTK